MLVEPALAPAIEERPVIRHGTAGEASPADAVCHRGRLDLPPRHADNFRPRLDAPGILFVGEDLHAGLICLNFPAADIRADPQTYPERHWPGLRRRGTWRNER